jgi:hypothetical protein
MIHTLRSLQTRPERVARRGRWQGWDGLVKTSIAPGGTSDLSGQEPSYHRYWPVPAASSPRRCSTSATLCSLCHKTISPNSSTHYSPLLHAQPGPEPMAPSTACRQPGRTPSTGSSLPATATPLSGRFHNRQRPRRARRTQGLRASRRARQTCLQCTWHSKKPTGALVGHACILAVCGRRESSGTTVEQARSPWWQSLSSLCRLRSRVGRTTWYSPGSSGLWWFYCWFGGGAAATTPDHPVTPSDSRTRHPGSPRRGRANAPVVGAEGTRLGWRHVASCGWRSPHPALRCDTLGGA